MENKKDLPSLGLFFLQEDEFVLYTSAIMTCIACDSLTGEISSEKQQVASSIVP